MSCKCRDYFYKIVINNKKEERNFEINIICHLIVMELLSLYYKLNFILLLQIADSFPGMNQYPQSLPPQQMHQQQQPVIELLKPPRWMKKPVGVSFGVF